MRTTLTRTMTGADGALYPRMTLGVLSDPDGRWYAGNAHAEARAAGITVCMDMAWGGDTCVACEVEDGNALMLAPMPVEQIILAHMDSRYPVHMAVALGVNRAAC